MRNQKPYRSTSDIETRDTSLDAMDALSKRDPEPDAIGMPQVNIAREETRNEKRGRKKGKGKKKKNKKKKSGHKKSHKRDDEGKLSSQLLSAVVFIYCAVI